jgi:ATP-dependent 26S proteasome regulatory subunit
MEKFKDYLGAGYPIIWVHTQEEGRAVKDLLASAVDMDVDGKGSGKKCYWWDSATGFVEMDEKKGAKNVREMPQPLDALKTFEGMPEDTLLFLPDFHFYAHKGAPVLIRKLKDMIQGLKENSKHIVITSAIINIPVEMEKDILLLDFPLPTVEELTAMASALVKGNAEEFRSVKVNKDVMLPGKGLTMAEAESAVALSLRTHRKIAKNVLEYEKLQSVRKSRLLEIYQPVAESELGGLDNLKKYIHNRKKGFLDTTYPQLSGIILVGLPGAGKSLSAKVIASVLDVPLVRMDVGSLKGSLVGESERQMRSALSQIDAISPCVVWMDEAEKALGGVQSSNRSDSGTTANMFGYLLTWMQESKSRKYVVATCNDIDDLLQISQGALLRRFDDIWFVDLPSIEERRAILKIMNKRYDTDIPEGKVGNMDNWTGAEIEKFCKASIYDGEDDAFANVKPIFLQNSEKLEKARQWAMLNARIANVVVPGTTGKGRKVKASAEKPEPAEEPVDA